MECFQPCCINFPINNYLFNSLCTENNSDLPGEQANYATVQYISDMFCCLICFPVVSHNLLCLHVVIRSSILQLRTQKIFNLGSKMLYQCISIEYVPSDCVPAVFGEWWWVTLVGNIIHVLIHLCFSSATSCPRMQNPCFKLLVFIIYFTLWQEGSASLEVDMDCLFFAVKGSKV